jgi:hypothetical protein
MKKVIMKVDLELINNKRKMKSLINDIHNSCIPGTINLNRIGLRKISFCVSDEIKVSKFDKLSISVVDV